MHTDTNALDRLGGYLKNHMGISGFIAMAAGVIVGNITVLEPLRYLIPVALFLMLYPSMLDVRPEGLAAVLAAPRLPIIALIMNFIISPVMIAGVSHGSGQSLNFDFISTEPRLDGTAARQNDRIYAIDGNLTSRPGPRLVDGLEQFAEFLHPELFKEE